MATHILVVDDETAIADLVEVYLKNEGFTIHKFYNASDALACVRTTRLNLAVLDVMLPDMDGFTLCQRIREDHLFPIIMLTAKVEDMDRNIGYIDKTGKEVIPLRYNKITDFWNGKAFAQEKSGEVFLIDRTGKKLKSIITGEYMREHGNGIISIEVDEQVAPGRVEYVKLYFDENGRISKEDARWRMRLSEGLAPYRDEKTKKYGYVNENGAWVIAPAFDVAEKFEDGYAVVQNEITLADGTKDVDSLEETNSFC